MSLLTTWRQRLTQSGLLQFALDLAHGRVCHCRACQVQRSALAIVSATETPTHYEGASSPQLEAEGLFRAALVVVLHATSTRPPAGPPVVQLATFIPLFAASIGAAIVALQLQEVVTLGGVGSEAPRPPSVH